MESASRSTNEHRAQAEHLPPVRVAIITISDTRTPETDKSGVLMAQLVGDAGHQIVSREILRDEPEQIRFRILELCGTVDAILTNGGTGISPRDGTFEAIGGIMEKTIPGFGELFRMLSWDEVGPAAMLSRALGGIRSGSLIFSTPGSMNAVQLAMTRLILPELRHLVHEMRKR